MVAVEEVRFAESRELVLDFRVSHPQPETEEPIHSLRFEGWVVGREGPVRAVRINDGRGKHIDLPISHPRDDIAALFPDRSWAEQCGFTARIGTLQLPREFQLELTALMENGDRAPLGFVRGRRKPLPALDARSVPIALTTIGRSGSTVLTWLLGHHPEVLAYRTFEFEPKVMAYFAELIRALSQPTSYVSALRGEIDNRQWWAGLEPCWGQEWYESGSQETDHWLGTEYVESLLEFFGTRLDALVSRLAQGEGKPGARRFVEKLPPTYFGQELWREVIPETREIFLVRDPRDVACSIFAFQRKMDGDWFWRSRERGEEEVIRQPLCDGVGLLTHRWMQRGEDAHLVRYEDLIEAPHETLTAVFEYLGVDASPATVDAALSGAARLDDERLRLHVTSPTPAQSVGRWRKDLSPALWNVCEEAFAPTMEAFGYT